MTVELSEEVDDATTVTVSVAVPSTLPTGVAITVTRPNPDPDVDTPLSGFADIEITDGKTGSTTATVSVTDNDVYEHPRDKQVLLTLTATGYDQFDDDDADNDVDNVKLTVRENDNPIGALSLSADPPALSVGGDGTTTLTVIIDEKPGQTDADPPEDITVPVTITTEHSIDGSSGGSATLDPIATDATSTSDDLTGVGVLAAGSVTVTASATNYTPGTVTIEIIDRSADDIEGFRVTIATPATDGAWVGYGPNKVKVHVTRLNAIAYSWTTFESVAIALRDTHAVTGLGSGDALGNIVTLTASGFAMEDDDVVFSSAALLGTVAIAHDPAVDKIYKDKSITYEEANDRLIFSFALPNLSPTPSTSDRDDSPADSLGTLAPTGPNNAPVNSARANDTAQGRRMAVFARATFTDGDDNARTLDSKDEKTKVFTSPSALASVPEADQIVGDGNLLKLDLIQPSNDVVQGLSLQLKIMSR